MYLEKLRLDERVAVVTGAGQGIGAAGVRARTADSQSVSRSHGSTRSDHVRPPSVLQ